MSGSSRSSTDVARQGSFIVMNKWSSLESLSPERNVRPPNNSPTLITHTRGKELNMSDLRVDDFDSSHDKFLEGVFPSRRQISDEPREVTEMIWSYDPPINKNHPNTRMECHKEPNYSSRTRPLIKKNIVGPHSIHTTADEPHRLTVSDAQIIPYQGDVSRCAEGGNTGRSDIPGNFAKLCEDRRHDQASDRRGSDARFAYIGALTRDRLGSVTSRPSGPSPLVA